MLTLLREVSITLVLNFFSCSGDELHAFYSSDNNAVALVGHYCERITMTSVWNARMCCMMCLMKNTEMQEGCIEVGYNETDSTCTMCVLAANTDVTNGKIYKENTPFKTMFDGPDIFTNFDEITAGGEIIDHQLTGIPNNGAQLVTDQFKSGKALYLDGVDQSVHIDISHLSTTQYCGKLPMTCTEGISYAIWYRDGPKVTVSYQLSQYLNHKGGHGGAFKLQKKHSNELRISIQGKVKVQAVSKNRWYHIFLTWRSDVGMKVYIDGSQVYSQPTDTNTGSENNAIWLGDETGNTNQFGSAWLDNFRIWQKYTDDNNFASFDMNNL